jgi:hypothetical protein
VVTHLARPLYLTYSTYIADTYITVKAMDDKTERFEMRVPVAFLKAIDDWRRKEDDLPSRAEAIRRLVEQALAAPAPRKAKGKSA